MAKISQKARMVYIEPNDLATGGEHIDNVVWNPEDFSMFVDLQVIIPDRNYDGSISYDNTVYSVSVQNNRGNNKFVSFMGGDTIKGENFITDDYLSAGYTEITATKVSNRNAIGITSLDIDFNEYFYPKVNATFVDIRGGALMNPAESEYTDGLKGGTAYTNLFRALFKYPYPRFLLTVKGFYGTKVTFQLAVNEFKTSLNSQTGNFDITVSFIGYMYGLYTDLPMNLIFISPYIDSYEDDPNAYWKESKNYIDSDGNRLLTFVEFMDRFVRVAESIAEDGGIDNEGTGISDYIAEKEKSEDYSKLLDLFNKLYNEIENNCNNCIIKNDKYWVFFVPKSKIAINVDLNDYNNCHTKIESISEKYQDNYEYGLNLISYNSSTVQVDGFLDPIVINNQIDTNSSAYSILSDDTNIISQIQYNVKNFNDKKVKIYEHKDIIKNIETKINSFSSSIAEKSQMATNEMEEIISSKLGFKPTIRNFMRMLFAHIDCFMRYMYEKVLDEVKTQQSNGERIKVSNFSKGSYSIDVFKNAGDDVYVPPFPGVYEINDEKYKEITYPSMFSTMPEVIFVDKIAKAAVNFRNAVNKIVKYAEQQGLTDNENGSYTMTFLPTCINDFYFNGVNPYTFLKYKGDSRDAIGELLYMFTNRYRASNQTFRVKEGEVKLESNNGTLTPTGEYKLQSDTDDRLPIAKDEALNYYKVKPKVSELFKTEFLSNGNNTSVIKQYLNDFISKYKNNTISEMLIRDGQYGHTDDVPIHFKTSFKMSPKYNETQFYRKTINSVDECADILRIFDRRFKSNVESFLKIDTVLSGMSNTDYQSVVGEKDDVNFVETSMDCEFYYGDSEGNFNRIYKIKTTSQEIPEYEEYDKDENGDGGEYWEMIQSIVSNGDFTNYRMPYVNFKSTKENFVSHPIMSVLSEEAKALSFLGLLPFDEAKLGKIVTEFLTKSMIKCMPKHVFLYICGLVYMYDYEKNGKKLFPKNDIVKFPDFQIKEGGTLRHSSAVFTHDDYIFMLEKPGKVSGEVEIFQKCLHPYKREILKKYFTDWVKGEFQTLKTRIAKSLDVGKTSTIGNIGVQTLLMKFYVNYVYVLNDVGFNHPNMKDTELTEFVNELAKLYGVESNNTDTTKKTDFTESDVSTEMKLGCYMTLKNLYDRWLASYRYRNFKLPDPGEEITYKQSKLNGNFDEMGEWNVCEYNNFLFVDNYYNDIGDDYMFNPRVVFDMVKMSADSDTNYSVYQFMSDLLQKNKMMLMALPLFSNYYNIRTIENIFKPYSMYGGSNVMTNGLGTTYLCMYTYEDSHVADFGGGDNCFANDGVDLADTLGDLMPSSSSDDINLFNTNRGTLEITVPAFGVTFSRQNQSIFKSITINSDDSRATDYGIKNTMQLAANARQGFVREPFGVGQDIFTIYSNRSYSCEITMMGCMNIMPMMYFQLNNIPMFKGAYMITHVSHSIKPGSIETKFKGIRVCRNQLPFNTDIFNLNAFIALVNEYTAKGRRYVSSVINGVSSGEQSNNNGTTYNGSDWAVAVQKMGAWYQANVKTYQSVCCNSISRAKRKRKAYKCDLLNGGTVYDDCSAFVDACLKYFGAKMNYEYACPEFTKNDPSKACYKTLKDAGFTRIDYSYSELKPYDIICGQKHTEIYYGKVGNVHKSYSWGNNHDGEPHTCSANAGKKHDVMPSVCSTKWIERNNIYVCIWRHS